VAADKIFLPLHEEQIKEAESLFHNHRDASTEDRLSIAAGRRRWLPLDWNGLSADYRSEAKEKLFTN